MPWYYNTNNERIEVTVRQLISHVENGEITPETRVEISEGNILLARNVRITNKKGDRTKLPFWYYFNIFGEKISVTFKQLLALVENGEIIPETRVEISEGNVIPAKNVQRTDGAKLPFWCYFNERDEQVAVTFQQLQQLARSETITRKTRVIAGDGRTCTAQDADGLVFPKQFFCTNCGNTVAEQADVCMSCGAKPIGHKKFCRDCGVSLNPEQVICTKCGASVKSTSDINSELAPVLSAKMMLTDQAEQIAQMSQKATTILQKQWKQAPSNVVIAVALIMMFVAAFIPLPIPRTCSHCKGEGKTEQFFGIGGGTCKSCNGTGIVVTPLLTIWRYVNDFY